MTRDEKVARFRALHAGPGAFLIPNAWDAGTSRIITAMGFDAVATTSGGWALCNARRDLVAETGRVDLLENARQIAAATDLPVSADLQNGFGATPEDCAETMRMAAAVGLAGASIEDAVDDRDNPIMDIVEATERVAAAAEAAKAANLVLTARAENFLHGRKDLDDTIRRLQAFAAAGAEVLYAPALPDLETVRIVCAAVDRPVNVLAGLGNLTCSADDLAAAGARRISVGAALTRAALGGFMAAVRELKETGTFGFTATAAPGGELARLIAAGAPKG